MVGYLVVRGDLSDADLDAVDDLLRTTTSGVLARYSTPWWEFGGIIRPGYDQSWYKGGTMTTDDDIDGVGGWKRFIQWSLSWKPMYLHFVFTQPQNQWNGNQQSEKYC